MTTYLGSFQNTVPLKSQNWIDFMARHPRYANGAWNWVTQCEKRRKKKKRKNLFSFHFFCREEQRLFLPVCWHCLSLKFSKQPSETHLRFWHKTSYFTHKKVDDILQLISEYTWVWEMSLFMKCEKKKKTCLSWWIHLIRFWQHVHDQNVCYWIICSN